MPSDKQLYEIVKKLNSYAAAARLHGLIASTLRSRIERYCSKNGLELPIIKTEYDGKAIYDKVIELGSIRQASYEFKLDRETLTRHLWKYCRENNLDIPEGESRNAKEIPVIEFPNEQQLKTEGIRRYVITSAHNNTPVHSKGFESLRRAAEHMDAQLCIIPLLYKNPSLFTSAQALAVDWPNEIKPYTIYENIIINSQWMIAGKLHIQATAARPLEGMQGFSKERSCVIGHARIAWETRPTPPTKPSICQITTGSISEPLYSDTKVGQLADFHHTLGALLIETDGEHTWVRHLRPSTSTGEFYDFEHQYGPAGYIGVDDQAVDAFVFGDLHQWFSTEQYLIQDLGRRYNPLHTIIHDPIDSFSISPHHEKDPLMKVAKLTMGMGNLEQEVKDLCMFHDSLQSNLNGCGQIVYVASNHTDHIMQWLKARDWRQMDPNSKVHRFLQNAYMEHLEDPHHAEAYTERGELPSVLELLMRRAGANLAQTQFPSVNDSLMIHDIECGQHGHKGPNGTKGTPGGFRRSQYKLVIGHLHSPGIYDGVHVVGTSGHKKMSYNDGLSGWEHAHEVIYRNRKRVLFTTVGGKHRLEAI